MPAGKPGPEQRHKLRMARKLLREVRGSALPRTPDHSLIRLAESVVRKRPPVWSVYGAPGGVYLGVFEATAPTTKRGRGVDVKVRRVSRADALNTLRRVPDDERKRARTKQRKGRAKSRLTRLYWIPPEPYALYEMDVLKTMVLRRAFAPLWVAGRGRLIERGGSVQAG